MEILERIFYDKVNEGKSTKRNKQEDILAILQLAHDNVHPIGILKVMHALVMPYHNAQELIKELVEEGLLQLERDGRLFRISAKGRKWLDRT
jgi:predicted transcriptional regulator